MLNKEVLFQEIDKQIDIQRGLDAVSAYKRRFTLYVGDKKPASIMELLSLKDGTIVWDKYVPYRKKEKLFLPVVGEDNFTVDLDTHSRLRIWGRVNKRNKISYSLFEKLFFELINEYEYNG